ncbi:MAG TPA: NUDIX domain-containing protein [Bacillota bacterium]|nr:NUDIX domain-containing protein [Bacillota bacterium]
MEKQKVFKDYIGQDIYLTFCPELFSHQPRHVLVVPIYQGKLLFTCHKIRGWELPGGKLEGDETPAEAAIRETWEETGADIQGPVQIGEYQVCSGGQVLFQKAIFLAQVCNWGERPAGFETNDCALFPIDVKTEGPKFSPYVQDQVFTSVQEFLYIYRNSKLR